MARMAAPRLAHERRCLYPADGFSRHPTRCLPAAQGAAREPEPIALSAPDSGRDARILPRLGQRARTLPAARGRRADPGLRTLQGRVEYPAVALVLLPGDIAAFRVRLRPIEPRAAKRKLLRHAARRRRIPLPEADPGRPDRRYFLHSGVA